MRVPILIAAICLLASCPMLAQDSVYYVHGVAVIREDTIPDMPNEDLQPKSNYIRLSAGDLPQELKKTLNEDGLFEGWEKAPLYFDKNLKLYVLHLSVGKTIRTYRFSEEGKPVSFNETNKPDQ